jgi:hypothetical protein
VGIGRRELAGRFDALLWVQTDADTARRRGLARDGEDAADFWAEWQAAEDPFQADQRPWERAGLVVSGAPDLPHDPQRELVVAPPPAHHAPRPRARHPSTGFASAEPVRERGPGA